MNGKTENDSWRTMGIIGSCRSVGVTHLAVWTANYLTGVRRERTAVLEWNTHGDFDRMGQFCKGDGKKGLYRILEVDYYAQAGMEELADCLNKDYQYIIVDYGEITGHKLLDCARCDLKVIVGSLSEWQAKMFSGAVTENEIRAGDMPLLLAARKPEKGWKDVFVFRFKEFLIPGMSLLLPMPI